jgi:putative ABC transport system substrate-binding protein
MALAADDPEAMPRVTAFIQSLAEFGWMEGGNLRIDYRWTRGDVEEVRKYAAELVAMNPDLILAQGSSLVGPLLQVTRTIPITFVSVVDPVGSGFVASLAHPGGNASGFVLFEYSIGAKWLELLKEIAPQVRRVAVLRDPTVPSGTGQLGAIQSVAPSFGVEVTSIDVRDGGEIERALGAFAGQANGGMIVPAGGWAIVHRDLIIKVAARHRVPAVYPFRYYVTGGGLISYGPDQVDQFRRAAGYVHRMLSGEKPAELAVQAPTRFELIINLRAAKALGLTIPPTLLARADEVIE